jgi:DNA-binding transcriptional MerR regulator
LSDSDVINYYLTADEAVQLLGCSKRTLRRYVSQGLIGKTGKGRGTKYSATSVLMLSRGKEEGKIDKVLRQLQVLAQSQQEIIARLSLLESIFMPRGGTLVLTPELVKIMKLEIRNLYTMDMTYPLCRDWAEDLLRLSSDSCKAIGFKPLARAVDHLITNASLLDETLSEPKNRIVVDQLRWFKHRLKVFSSLKTSAE